MITRREHFWDVKSALSTIEQLAASAMGSAILSEEYGHETIN